MWSIFVPLSPRLFLYYLFNYSLRVVVKVQLPHLYCCGLQSHIAWWHFFCTVALFSRFPMVHNIVFVSDKHTLVFQPSLTLYVLPLVTESTISHSFHYPCDNNHGVSLHLKFSNVSDQVLVVSLFSASLWLPSFGNFNILLWQSSLEWNPHSLLLTVLLEVVVPSLLLYQLPVYNFGRAAW